MKRPLKTSAQIVGKRGRTAFGYNAIEDTTRRRKPVTRTSSELLLMTAQKRETASATTREDRRNFTVLAWMVRRHLDSVSRFMAHFRIPSKDPAVITLNGIVQRLLRWHGRRAQFDALGRHGRDEFMRMYEACKVIEGDCGALKVQGGKLQGIEGDRIAVPRSGGSTYKAELAGKKYEVTQDGIVFGKDGSRFAFSLCKRAGDRGDQLEFERLIPAADLVFDGYWPERFDSNRGVSPLLTALNEGADVRETCEWHVLKAKASGIFGFAFTRKGSDEMYPSAGEAPTEATTTEDASYGAQVSNGLKSRGIINLDLDPGDTVAAIESAHPNPNLVPFTRELIRWILLALDIPFTMYDSLASSFSARSADRNEYDEACEWKRGKNIDVLNDIYAWLFPMWEVSNQFGFGDALKATKLTVEEVLAHLDWMPAGRPWLDRTEEMKGHILALAAGVTSTPRICGGYGDDAYAIAAEQEDYLSTVKIPLLYAQGGQQAVQTILNEPTGPKPKDEAPATKEPDHAPVQ